MKIALVTDTHFGARSDNLAFDAYFEKFYTECFFPYLEKEGIKTIYKAYLADAENFLKKNELKK